jgi:hypothetical protein
MQWKEFKRIVEEELGITNETEVWMIDVNLPVASEFLHVKRDTLLGTSITAEEPRNGASEHEGKRKKIRDQTTTLHLSL